MKKILLLLALCFSSLTYGGPIQDRRIAPEALFQLAEALGIPSDQNVVEEATKRWLRNPSLERWEIEELPESQRCFVLNWAKDQGLFSDWKPASAFYPADTRKLGRSRPR